MWLTGKLAPDFKTIADFRRDNGEAIRAVCRQFALLCRGIGLIGGATVAVDGSRFKTVNTRDKNYTPVQSVCGWNGWTPASRGIWGCSTPPIARKIGWPSCGLPG